MEKELAYVRLHVIPTLFIEDDCKFLGTGENGETNKEESEVNRIQKKS